MFRNCPLLLLLLLCNCSAVKTSQVAGAPTVPLPAASCLAGVSRLSTHVPLIVVNQGSGKVLDVKGTSAAPGTPLLHWPYHAGRNQQFILSEAGDGFFTMSTLLQQPVLDHQALAITHAGHGSYLIKRRDSGLLLTADSESAQILQADDRNDPHQRWLLVTLDDLQEPLCADGFAQGTIGGGAITPTEISSCEALIQGLESPNRQVLQLHKTLDCRTAPVIQSACAIACGSSDPGKVSYRIPVPGQSCVDLGNADDARVDRTRNERRVRVKSNKTLIGIGAQAGVLGISFDLTDAMNIIIKNIAIGSINPDLIEAGDGITLSNSRQVWIDHVRFQLISDGYVDIQSSRGITLSYNHFIGKNPAVCGNQHHYTHLVQDSQVTFHHNHWDAASGRNPKLSGAATRAHLYNNLWQDITYFAVNAKDGAQAKIEGNVFDNASRPHWNEGGSGFIEADPTLNRYLRRSAAAKEPRDNTGPVFADQGLYPYALDSLDVVQSQIPGAVGPQP